MNDLEKTSRADSTEILVIGGDKSAADRLAEMLRTRAYAVSICAGRQEALNFVGDHGVDLIFLAATAPGEDGAETARQLRDACGRTNFVPVILVGASGEAQDNAAGLRYADDFITAPFRPDEVFGRIRVMLRMRQIHRELVLAKNGYEFLYENSPYMYVIIDANRIISDCNVRFCSMIGLGKSEVAGTGFLSFFLPEDHKMITSFLDLLAKGSVRPPPPMVTGIAKKGEREGEGVYVSLSAMSVGSGGLRGSFMITIQDVTRNVRLEREQRLARSQLYRSARLASIGTFASGVAHELNNPLTAILGFSGAISERVKKEEDIDKEELAQYMSIINAETLRCRDTVENLSRFAREGDVQIRDFFLAECIEGALRLVKSAAAKKRVTIRESIPRGTRVRADLQKLQQAAVYILTNSLDFCSGGNSVSISAESDGRFVRMSISDDGPGIPPDVLPKVFDPFFTTKEVGQGMGLGLAMSHVIMEECNGAIDISSDVGKGTVVSLDIPSGRSLPDGGAA
jgi:PAS domain S-box-containing protein